MYLVFSLSDTNYWIYLEYNFQGWLQFSIYTVKNKIESNIGSEIFKIFLQNGQRGAFGNV